MLFVLRYDKFILDYQIKYDKIEKRGGYMKEKYNSKSIGTGLFIILIGIVLILLDIFVWDTERNIWISIGCSLLASGIVILATALLVDGQ